MKKMSIASIALTMLLAVAAWGQANPQAVRITNGPVVQQPAGGAAAISWSTNVPGSSVVKYGTNPSTLDQTAQAPWGGEKQPNGDFTHTVWVKNLQPNTVYYYTVETGQGQGTGTQMQSQPQQFHTLGAK
jgi:phosphodiesterase/alkaline phosphatase D-like protein